MYFVRYNDNTSLFANFKKVTDLALMQQGGRPKIVATPSEAHVQFVGSNLQMHSRDLDLATGNWDNNYIISSVATTNAVSSTTVSGNRIFCLIAEAPGQNSPQPQNFYLVSRAPADQNWSSPQYVTTTTSGIGEGYMRNTIIASPSNASVSKVYVATTCNTQSGCADQVGITLRTYSSTGLFEVAEPIYNGNTNASLVFLSASRFGAYAYWPGSMRRKPFLIGGTISERTLLTGNNWVDYFIVDGNTTLDAMSFSQTDFIGGFGSQVDGIMNAYEGAQFRFAGGGGVFVYGRLFTYGSESKKVVFTAINPSAPWGALFLQTNGGFCSISHADISYGGLDIRSSRVVLTDSRIHHTPYFGLFLFNMTHPKNSIVIERTRIDHHNYQNESGWGVIMRNAWNATIRNSTIDSCFRSMSLENSRPRLYGNNFHDNEIGVFLEAGSDPRFGDRVIGDYGYNCSARNNNWDLYAWGSTAFLGLNTQNGVMGGFNSLVKQGSSGVLVFAGTDPVYGDSYVEAEKNWWESDPPDPSKFNTSGNSKIDYTYWLPSTTCGGSGSSPIVKGGLPIEGGLMNALELLRTATAERGRRNYNAAIAIYRSLVEQFSDSPEALVGLRELLNTYYDSADWSNDSLLVIAMRTYLRGLGNNHSNGRVRKLAKTLYALELQNEARFQEAEQVLQSLLAAAISQPERQHFTHGLFSLHALGTHNRAEAERYLSSLQQLWPRDSRTKLAEILFARLVAMPSRYELGKSEGSLHKSIPPTDFALRQNYPNPFNPTTTIRFQIPTDGFVSLKVYNMLGQAVAMIVNEVRNAGTYTEAFDASHLASGVYVYQLTSSGFMASKKFLLLK